QRRRTRVPRGILAGILNDQLVEGSPNGIAPSNLMRLPVPSLWPDILQKVKAAGLNAVSVYTHMGLINPAPDVVDFNDFRALQPLYDAAKAAGIWIVLRPGPYINAETTAGGIAHWATSQVAGQLRTNASDWRAAWQAYIQGIIDETVPNQITQGGPVIAIQIDNEYSQNPITNAEYFVDLEAVYKDPSSGIVV
ncbi:putative beta-galactosidase C, partial [Termitomyces sp. T112]